MEIKWIFVIIGVIITVVTLLAWGLSRAITKGFSDPGDAPKKSPSSPVVTIPKRSPSPTKPFFNSLKTITSSGSSTFNFTDGYLTYRGIGNIRSWNVDLPLNFTHARMNGKVFKFNNPNSSDSSGKFVSLDTGEPLATQPANFYTNTIEFGMFF